MSSSEPLRIAYLTAGASGMYCGSCLHDNTLARELIRQGVDVQLIPLYTPIQSDETDVTIGQVFFGGLNVYLQQHVRLFRHLPRWIDRLLDRPGLLRWIGSRGIETSAEQLGDLTVSMLRGSAGFQRKEVDRLCQWLTTPPTPHLLLLTNMLIAGCVPDLKAQLDVPVVVTLQGDDVYLEALPSVFRERALDEIRRLADHVDAFFVHSQYYADFMAEYLGVDRNKFHLVPLGIDISDFPATEEEPPADAAVEDVARPLRIGYLARLEPEKGLHVLTDAFVTLKQMPAMETTELLIAGWLGKRHRRYAESQFAKLRAAGLAGAWRYLGTVDRAEKCAMLRQIDVLSVPTVYREPKGLYVLEALAAGVPVVQPGHGAFPELLQATGGGELVTPDDPDALAQVLHGLLTDHARRSALGRQGQHAVHTQRSAPVMARETLAVLQEISRQYSNSGRG